MSTNKNKATNFELFCSMMFFILGLFFTNTYTVNNFNYFPVTVAFLCASIYTGYCFWNDLNNKNKLI